MILNRLGKKTKIAQKIQQYFPLHNTYVEPFFGAGGMYFNKPKAKYNILNDNDSNVFHLYQTLKRAPNKLVKEFMDMPKHGDLLKYCRKEKPTDPFEKTNCFLMGSNMTFLGKGSTLRYGNANERNNFKEKAKQTYDYLKDAQFMNKDFRKVIDSIADREKGKAFVYADPPYVGTSSNYEDKSWKPQDLDDLMGKLKNSKVKFAISEFDSPDVLRLARKHKLKVLEIGERRNLGNRRTEVLVVNYDAKQEFKRHSKNQLLTGKKTKSKKSKSLSDPNGINVLSAFDGISVAQLALKNAKIKVNKYYAAEIDPYAASVAQKNFKNTIQLGDVRKVKDKHLEDIDLLVGGSPCQGFSLAGNRLNFKDKRSQLFFEFVRLKKLKKPKYFLFENVVMDKKAEAIITKALGVEPTRVNSSKVSGQNRDRLYWTNLPKHKLKDRNKMFHDAVEGGTNCKRDKFSYRDYDFEYDPDKKSLAGTKNIGNYSKGGRNQSARIFSTCNSKSPTITTQTEGIKIVDKNGKVRQLTPEETEALQDLPRGYTAGHSDSRRRSMIGNSFTTGVIEHFVEPIKKEQLQQKKKFKKPIKLALMTKPKKMNKTKIIRNVAIGGLALVLLAKATKAMATTPTTTNTNEDTPIQGVGILFTQALEGNFGSLDNAQRNAINEIVNAWEIFGDGDLHKLAYIFATTWHESKLRPIEERRARPGTSLYETQNRYWNTGFYGRGFVQLTHESNYKKMSNFLGVDLVSNPALALDPYYAGQIIVYGMMNGSFTGVGLGKYITSNKQDYLNARRVVNGTDRAELIRDYTNQLVAIALSFNV